MAKITLTVAEDRQATVTESDVVQVRIEYPYHIDSDIQRASFRYTKGHLESSVYVVDYESQLVTISGYDYATYVDVVPPAPLETLISNIERKLLQYLLDKNIVAAGAIS